jgi:murein DD-endopeptidase MepM/ murein hydrolase activator NlpD
MGDSIKLSPGIARVATVVVAVGLLAACDSLTRPPAPVDMRGGAPMTARPAPPPMRQVTVEDGQNIGKIAHKYHVPLNALVAANHLTAPYKLKIGQRLLIPDHSAPGDPAPIKTATAPTAAAAAVTAATPLAPPAAASSPAAKAMPDVVPLDGPPPPPAATGASSPPPATSPPPPPSQAAAAPPPPAGSGPPAVVAPRNAAAALPLPGEQGGAPAPPPPPVVAAPPAQAAAPAPAAQPAPSVASTTVGGRFPWPVRGRVLTAYGAAPDGRHNDGINISAPRGTPVRAIDAGVVAYIGNEVRGYGNLIMVKHASGLISAYAHLENIEVKLGDQVGGGQEIAKVGNTGGVIEPQLHFELRRGKVPVDPREFLAPAPSAGDPSGPSRG